MEKVGWKIPYHLENWSDSLTQIFWAQLFVWIALTMFLNDLGKFDGPK